MLCLTLVFMKYKQFMCPNQFLKSLLCAREGREWLAPLLVFCVIEEWLQHDRFCHPYIFCVIQPWWSCLSIFSTKEYWLKVWPKLELPGALCSKLVKTWQWLCTWFGTQEGAQSSCSPSGRSYLLPLYFSFGWASSKCMHSYWSSKQEPKGSVGFHQS